MRGVADRQGMEVLDLDECMALAGSVPVARVAFVDQGGVVVLPVNHTVVGRTVAWRSGAGAKLDAAIMERPVTVEVDGWDAATLTWWSVLLKGHADLVDDPDEQQRLAATGVVPWWAADQRETWVALRPTEVSGRRIVPSALDG